MTCHPLPIKCAECGAATESYNSRWDKKLKVQVTYRVCTAGHRGKFNRDTWEYLGRPAHWGGPRTRWVS